MDYKKGFIYCALAFIIFFLYSQWQIEHPAKPAQAVSAQAATSKRTTNVPSIAAPDSNTGVPSAVDDTTLEKKAPAVKHGSIVNVKTDVLSVQIDTLGGKLITAKLLKYPQKFYEDKPITLGGITLFHWRTAHYSDKPFSLLSDKSNTLYIAESGLTGVNGPDTHDHLATYSADKPSYTLETGKDEVNVILHWKNKDGIKINKVFSFKRDSYNVSVKYVIDNGSAKPWRGHVYALLDRKEVKVISPGIFHLSTYLGAAVSTPEKRLQKVSFSDMEKAPLNEDSTGGWISMMQHYFITAWVPNQQDKFRFYSVKTGEKQYAIGLVGSEINVPVAGTASSKLNIYMGPTIPSNLSAVAPHLDLTVDYGWLWLLAEPIFWVMQHLYFLLGNWGWSIVFVTLIIKLIFYPLSSMSYRSMAAMRTLQPKMQALKDRYGDDKQKMSQATMELYKKEKVNPLSGCLPILIQIPFFIALYYVLMESVELRQAPFMFWIHDLSTRDPYFILPILMGASMYLQQRLSPAPPDPAQARVMMFLPILFTGMFLFFPAGLVLYWLVNNVLSISQQWYITKRYEKASKKKRPRKKKK